MVSFMFLIQSSPESRFQVSQQLDQSMWVETKSIQTLSVLFLVSYLVSILRFV